ncbi:PREDICTED: uncharacterized protein LOC105953208 [Erythranthe guttata]|uniref:uncharacterized protein LOC105953208 n=1 Tax=Erythranthe guttata TaxID=4155 RepID=UPI00064DE427|nr:PREDICTED: uncharacterized protein LOC105953208 [Erythranthe guttata]|eukprot:XP_012832304.1 PREDICTED: uncharacterized protein LOC105953208 [Erythranthe guttata]
MANVEDISYVTEGRGREAHVNNKKKRDHSKARGESTSTEAVLTDHGERLERLENNIAIAELSERFEKLEHDTGVLENHVAEQLDLSRDNEALREERLDRFEAIIQSLQESIEGMRDDLALCKKAAANGSVGATSSPRVDCPKPTGFNGVRDAKEVENFLWRMEQYFEGIGLVDETTKVRTSSLYLSDTAMLWWRRKHADIEKGICRIDTWEEFKRELKRHFYPENVVYEARRKLRELKQRSSIREYVTEFTTLTLQIPNLSEEDLLFHFTDGLQGWAKQELHRRDIKSVDEAIAAAESLTEYQPREPLRKEKWSPTKGGEERRDNHGRDYRDNRDPRRASTSRGGDKPSSRHQLEEKKKSFVPKGGCFVCKGPHAMSQCPKMGSLSALLQQEAEQDTNEELGHMGSLQLLNALKANPMPATSSKELMYVEARINGTPAKVMVDTGATHNFITEDEAKRVGLRWTRRDGWLKAANAKAQPLNGVARDAELHLATWKGQVDFSVAPMDDFKVVLGMDFFRKVMAIPMPCFNSLCILEKGTPCMVPAINGTTKEENTQPRQLSAMQVAKGVRRGEPTFLAALKEESPPVNKEEDVSPIIQTVLEASQDVMPPNLPNKLPPRREVDHATELVEMGEIRPSKASVGADALSRKAEPTAISSTRGNLADMIREGLEHDPMTKELIRLVKEGKTRKFWVEDGLLYTKGQRLFVPKWGSLRKDLIKECHDTKWAGHPGQMRTMTLLETAYFWPHMRDGVDACVKTCLVCQQDKVESKQPAGLEPHQMNYPSTRQRGRRMKTCENFEIVSTCSRQRGRRRIRRGRMSRPASFDPTPCRFPLGWGGYKESKL